MNPRAKTHTSRLSTQFVFGILFVAGVAIGQPPTGLTFKETRQLFPWADMFKPIKDINETTKIAEVWDTDDPIELLGWAIVKEMAYEDREFSLVLGIKKQDRAISKIMISHRTSSRNSRAEACAIVLRLLKRRRTKCSCPEKSGQSGIALSFPRKLPRAWKRCFPCFRK